MSGNQRSRLLHLTYRRDWRSDRASSGHADVLSILEGTVHEVFSVPFMMLTVHNRAMTNMVVKGPQAVMEAQ